MTCMECCEPECGCLCHEHDGNPRLPKWISIKERLPDLGQEVVVFAPMDEILSYKSLVVFEGVLHSQITHWMPLPDEPKLLREQQ